MIGLRGKITGLIILPAFSVVLPWTLFFRLARGMSRFSWLFRTETQMAIAGVKLAGQFIPDEVWQRHYRLYKIVDAADPWLCRFRGRGWFNRYVDIEGSWPGDTPFVASSMHFGAGLWALRHIQQARAPISMVLRPHDQWQHAFSKPMRYYLESYERAIVDAGGGSITHTGPGLTRRFESGIDAGANQLVLVDVPSKKKSFTVNFLGQPTCFAVGLVNISLQLGLPIVPYVMTLDFHTGRRQLVIGEQLDQELDLQPAMQQLANFFDPFVRKQSEGWQLWGQYPVFLNTEPETMES